MRRSAFIALCVIAGAVVAVMAVIGGFLVVAQLRGGSLATDFGGTSVERAAPVADTASPTARRVAQAAMSQVGKTVTYNADYVPIGYPGGDVPIDRGACTDVVVRAFRVVGVDLQVRVHEDMSRHFSAYPHKWDLTHPDANIDHRRVPNLQVYFTRAGKSLAVAQSGADYQPGDVVTWSVNTKPHTGVVSTVRSADGSHFLIAHNIGSGVHVEDVLFAFPITGHYRYF